jgi:hypothetical protein
LFGYFPIPDLVPRDPDLFAVLRSVHRILSRVLIAVVALQARARASRPAPVSAVPAKLAHEPA